MNMANKLASEFNNLELQQRHKTATSNTYTTSTYIVIIPTSLSDSLHGKLKRDCCPDIVCNSHITKQLLLSHMHTHKKIYVKFSNIVGYGTVS